MLSFFPKRPFGSREMIKLRHKDCSFVYSLVLLCAWKADFLFIALSFWMQSVAAELRSPKNLLEIPFLVLVCCNDENAICIGLKVSATNYLDNRPVLYGEIWFVFMRLLLSLGLVV